MSLKIDIFCHFLPPKYLESLQKKATLTAEYQRELDKAANVDLDVRLRLMERYPEVLQVLSISQPPIEKVVSPEESAELARIANDELAELTVKYPNRFVGAVACLPMSNIEAALDETDRAIRELNFRGIEIYSNINGEELDAPKFRPIYEKMVQYDLPIWLHPCRGETGDQALFGWPYETSSAVLKLVTGGVIQDYPDIKFIVHHAGSMVPFFERRIKWVYPLEFGLGIRNPLQQFKRFYCDTATYGSTAALMCAYEFFGAGHMLFGTDMPLGPRFGLTAETIRAIERAKIPEEEKEDIFRNNAVDLLRIAI
jgi:predicted TIM-barrel fold metal-dependent hydrolase